MAAVLMAIGEVVQREKFKKTDIFLLRPMLLIMCEQHRQSHYLMHFSEGKKRERQEKYRRRGFHLAKPV